MAKVDDNEDETWNLKFREDEEMEFFTELALHETERWIQAVTKKKFAHPDDFRKSLENGVLLCELLNNLKPGAVKRINKLPGAIAGLDNINVFLKACRTSFGLTDKHLFDPNDLEDLSQRAIADSEHQLKQEEDRRAINVAITVYWLGRSVASSYSGPHIDISAFAALVHHHGKDLISDEHFRHDSWESSGYNSSAYSSHESNSKVSLPDEISFEQKHTRDSSYESYGSYSRGSESLDEENMPVRRYGSASSLNRSGEQLRFSATSDIYSDGGQDSLYQSSPDLVQGNHNHHRSSSTDSMDGSYHSRQSSDSVENYPTRTRSTTTQRKTSTAVDPLQFIKAKPANDLAKTAEAQIKATEAVKTERVKVEKELDIEVPDDNWQSTQPSDTSGTDWQSNLSSWRNRRRRQSAATYERVEGSVDGTEEKKKDENEDKKKPKTYNQIKAERDKRKSTGTLNIYPIDDDDSWLTSIQASHKKTESEPVTESVTVRTTARTEYTRPSWKSNSLSSLKQRPSSVGSDKFTSYDDTNVAPWAEELSDDESESQKITDQSETSSTDSKSHVTSEESHVTSTKYDKDKNDKISEKSERYSSWRNRGEVPEKKSSPVSLNNRNDSSNKSSKVSGLLKSFEQKEEGSKVSYEKPRKSFQFSASESSRRSEGFKSQKSKSFDTASAGLTFSASPVHTEKVKSPVNASVKPLVNPALLRKDTSPKQETVSAPKNYVEKTIKINQKPKNERGFGFTISGGADKKQPIEVTKVNLGSAADVNELQVHDEIVSINRRDITSLTHSQVIRLMEKGVDLGEIELEVKRKITEDDIWDDEDDDAFENTSTNKLNSSTGRSYSPLQSQNRGISPVQQNAKTPEISYSASPMQRSFSPVQSSPLERSWRGTAASPGRVKDEETTSPKLETSTPVQTGERRRQSPLTFNASTASPRLDRNKKLEDDNIETESEDEKMWIMDKLVNSQPNNMDYSQGTAGSYESRQERKIEAEKHTPQIEIVFSHQVSPPERQEVEEETEIIQKSVQSNQYSQPPPVPTEPPTVQEASPKVDVEVIERPTVVMRRRKQEPPKSQENELLKWESTPKDKPATATTTDNSDDFGPPAALRRWQRPRPRSEYNYPTSNSVLDHSDDFKKRLSGTWQLDKPSTEPESSNINVQFSSGKKQFEMETRKLQQQYDDDERQKTEMEISMPQQGQQSENLQDDVSNNIEEPIRFHVSSQQQSELRIDPRNQYPSEQPLPQYNFHLSLGASDKNNMDSQRDDLELERQRIREEEKRHLEEEKKKWEEEERRRIQEKEEQLREQEEMLRQERERLRQEQEEMEKKKNELERTRIENDSPRFEQPTNRDYSRSTFNSRPQFSTSANVDTKVGPRRLDTAWPPNDQDVKVEKEKQKLTREDLLAMNRKATPLQRKPEQEVVENNSDNSANREVPTRHHDLHSLNVVPKSRIRNSVDWISSNDKHYDNTAVRRSGSPHEHWLVEEAERRRMAGSKGRPERHSVHGLSSTFSGPIKPVSEGLSNKWRDDSNVIRQQTFDTSNVGLTKPRSLYSSSQNDSNLSAKNNSNVTMSQTLPSNFNYDSLNSKRDFAPPVVPKPMRSSPNPPSPSSPSSPANHAEQVTAVSGKQGCSNCGQELGFGAAMVIESLGLYYHVQCFRCCVCHTTLGNGSQGADVRVRVNKLHCRNCYSNDEAGLKFSKV